MTFFPRQGRVVMSSQITHTQSSKIIVKLIDCEKNRRVKLIQLYIFCIYETGYPLFPIFRVLSLSLHSHSSVAQDHLNSHHPSSLTSSYIVSATPLTSAINTLLCICKIICKISRLCIKET